MPNNPTNMPEDSFNDAMTNEAFTQWYNEYGVPYGSEQYSNNHLFPGVIGSPIYQDTPYPATPASRQSGIASTYGSLSEQSYAPPVCIYYKLIGDVNAR